MATVMAMVMDTVTVMAMAMAQKRKDEGFQEDVNLNNNYKN